MGWAPTLAMSMSRGKASWNGRDTYLVISVRQTDVATLTWLSSNRAPKNSVVFQSLMLDILAGLQYTLESQRSGRQPQCRDGLADKTRQTGRANFLLPCPFLA